jgi:hypothetical protein
MMSLLLLLVLDLQAEESEPWVISPNDMKHLDLWLEDAHGAGNLSEPINIFVDVEGEMMPLADFEATVVSVPEKYPHWSVTEAPNFPLRIGTDMPGANTGILSGKTVYLSQCHGWYYYEVLGRFSTQRGNLYSTIEDFHNPEGANQFLVHYLENMGAQVFTAKERGLNPNMDIADNDGGGYSETGTGFESGSSGFADTSPWLYGEDPFDAGTTRRFPSNGGSIATWIPDVPEDGYYNVYVSWDSAGDNNTNAHYRITHKGSVIDRYFDQRVHGSTWQYVENLWLEAGSNSLTVELIADSSSSGKWLSADAVRVGGGTGDVQRYGDQTNRPRWEESAVLYTQFNGAPTSVYDPYGDGNGSDPSARSRWAAWEHPTGEDAVYLSWHSNAGGGTGTDTFYDSSGPVAGSEDLANFVHGRIMEGIREAHDSNWANRGVKTANFGEINSSFNNEMPSILVELGFHDSAYDTDFLLDPIFRRDAARSMAFGIAEYFTNKDGTSLELPPEPPIYLQTAVTTNGILIQWDAGDYGDHLGDVASDYVLYTSSNGRSWDNGTVIANTETTVPFSNSVQYFRVSARNGGGLSFPSETIAAFAPNSATPPILLVSAFDRLQRSSLFWEDTGVVGDVLRMNLRNMNAFDTSIGYAQALGSLGYPFVTVSNEVLDGLPAVTETVIIWIAGEESTFDDTFNDVEQDFVQDSLSQGSWILASGAEILWDLDTQGSQEDQDFAMSVFASSLGDDDANVYQATGEEVLAGIDLNFSFEQGAQYNVEYPDVIESNATVIATYSGSVSTGIAGVWTEQSALFGFPLELLWETGVQQEVLERILGVWLEGYEVSDPSDPSSEPSTEPSGEPSTEPDSEDTDVVDTGDGEIDKRRGCSQSNPIVDGLLWISMLSIFGCGYRRRR